MLPPRQPRLLKLDHTPWIQSEKIFWRGFFTPCCCRRCNVASLAICTSLNNNSIRWKPITTNIFPLSNCKYLDFQYTAHQPNFFYHFQWWVTGQQPGRNSFCHPKKTGMSGFIYNIPFHPPSTCYASIYPLVNSQAVTYRICNVDWSLKYILNFGICSLVLQISCRFIWAGFYFFSKKGFELAVRL